MIDESAKRKQVGTIGQARIAVGLQPTKTTCLQVSVSRIKQMRQLLKLTFSVFFLSRGRKERNGGWEREKNEEGSFQMRFSRDDSFSGINARMQRGRSISLEAIHFCNMHGTRGLLKYRLEGFSLVWADTREVRTTAMKNRTILSRRASNDFWSIDEELWILSLF